MAARIFPLGELLARQPARARHPGKHARPSFVVHTLHPLPHKDAAWFMLIERFAELAEYTRELERRNDERPELTAAAEGFYRVVTLLRTVSGA